MQFYTGNKLGEYMIVSYPGSLCMHPDHELAVETVFFMQVRQYRNEDVA